MTQYLKNISFTVDPSSIFEVKDFFEKVFIEVGYKNKEGINRFYLDIIGLKWFFNFIEETDNAIYLKQALVLNKFDKNIINEFIKKKIELCNFETNENSSFICLSKYFEYEAEEWLCVNDINSRYIHKNATWSYSIDFPKIHENENWNEFNKVIYLNLKEQQSNIKYVFRLNIISPVYIQNKLTQINSFFTKGTIVIKFFDQKIIKDQIKKVFKKLNYKNNEHLIPYLSCYFENV
ncbi:hypothetical protein GF322_00460 [Candidatus Dependentiae bacterium]|nr:hypothetical protein [Candidatus Dependentiae bacterium]